MKQEALQARGQNRVHGFQRSKSRADKLCFFRQIFPKCPICCCRGSGIGRHMRNLQQTKLLALSLGYSHNVLKLCLSQNSARGPLQKKTIIFQLHGNLMNAFLVEVKTMKMLDNHQ